MMEELRQLQKADINTVPLKEVTLVGYVAFALSKTLLLKRELSEIRHNFSCFKKNEKP